MTMNVDLFFLILVVLLIVIIITHNKFILLYLFSRSLLLSILGIHSLTLNEFWMGGIILIFAILGWTEIVFYIAIWRKNNEQ